MRRLFCFALTCTAIAAQADLRLASPFTDHVVLQRDAQVPIWGWASPGASILVTSGWGGWAQTQAGLDGKWSLKLPTRPAGGPYEIEIQASNGEKLMLRDVLIGEVWLCSGQSNMEMSVRKGYAPPLRNEDREIELADYPRMRFFKVPVRFADTPQETCDARWEIVSPQTVGAASAVGYFFGRELYRALGVPVGLIMTTLGGTEAELWTSVPGMRKVPGFSRSIDDNNQAIKGYRRQVQIAQRRRTLALDPKSVQDPQPTYKRAPGWLWNGQVAPLVPFAIKGVVWYQGEANVGRAAEYMRVFPNMIHDWRAAWNQGDFPFYFVQIAPWTGYGNGTEAAELREAQEWTMKSVRKTGMVVTTDITDDFGDIHPVNKQDVARRLALWALALSYGKRVEYSGPLYAGMTVEGSKVRLNFTHAFGLGIRGERAEGFLIAGDDRQFVPAKAKVDGDTILVWSDKVANPVAVRFGYGSAVQTNLFNHAGLPAAPFRTDRWPMATAGRAW